MKVGSVGYATYQGLGLLLKDFYDNGVVTDAITVNHWKYVNHLWYGNGPITHNRNFHKQLLFEFSAAMDVMFFFETAFEMDVIKHCRKNGVKTLLMPMHECTARDSVMVQMVDKIINPSLLDQKHYPRGKFIPVPIPRHIKWKLHERARVFVHNAGHLGLDGRNGTLELMYAMRYVKSPIKLIIRSQDNFFVPTHVEKDNRVEFRIGTVPTEELYQEGDVFIFPEKFNGLSLPLQEAKASGMLVMTTNRFPINTWTNTDPLIPIVREQEIVNRFTIPVMQAVIDPEVIAKTIDDWYGRDITDYSIEGRVFGEMHSWDKLKGVYMQEILGCFR